MTRIFLHLATGEIRVVAARRGQSFLHVLFEQGLTVDKPICAGVGLCGQCKVRFLKNAPRVLPEEAAFFGADAIADGWRLACRHHVDIPVTLAIPSAPSEKKLISGLGRGGDALAIDIGTTRIKWAPIVKGVHGRESGVLNPQMGAGSEIMARLLYAQSFSGAAAYLCTLLVDCIRSIVGRSDIQRLAISGNTTMISLLLRVSLQGLSHVPYSVPFSGGKIVAVADGLPPAYIPPLLGPFIGADVSAGLAYLRGKVDVEYPFLLADLGTNGEFVLAVDPKTFVAASVPMGPAIEGVGLCCGAPFGADIASRFELTPNGLSSGGASLTGISGTGYISLLAILRRVGLVDIDGHFTSSMFPLGRKISKDFDDHPLGRILRITHGVFLAERDIEEFLKVKAGVNAAVRALCEVGHLSLTDVKKVYLAGALGENIESRSLFELGLLPRVFEGRIVVAGNTSLAGTLKTLEDPVSRTWLAKLPPLVRIVDLVNESEFGRRFVRAMRFEWV
ncbi:MAG: ASKHA domain-containing protein [Bacteroidales bacterium]|nr:ASKHA domain-containing protein [Bacteroidales bacterium]